eukprot:gene15310-15455_t
MKKAEGCILIQMAQDGIFSATVRASKNMGCDTYIETVLQYMHFDVCGGSIILRMLFSPLNKARSELGLKIWRLWQPLKKAVGRQALNQPTKKTNEGQNRNILSLKNCRFTFCELQSDCEAPDIFKASNLVQIPNLVKVTSLAQTLFYRYHCNPVGRTCGFAPELVARGQILAAAGSCATCHTAKGSKPYAGGYAMKTSFGTIYSSNITPDPKTGIGAWSEGAFRRALHDGVARDGALLYPVFPYDHFTKISDSDVTALYAFMMTLEPFEATPPSNILPFPLSIRALQAGWKLLFFKSGALPNQETHSVEWNRGAYLAEAVAHCGACHTPRNSLGAEIGAQAYAGSLLDGKPVPALTRANFSPVPWSQQDLFAYLRTGNSTFHGRANGPMGAIVRDGLSKLPDSDIQALAVYFANIGDTAARAPELQTAIARVKNVETLDLAQHDATSRLYLTACASCHYDGADNPPHRPNLALLGAINSPDPSNLISTVVYGRGASMPAFSPGLSDADIAHILAYLRATRTDAPPWTDLEAKVTAVRAKGNPKNQD